MKNKQTSQRTDGPITREEDKTFKSVKQPQRQADFHMFSDLRSVSVSHIVLLHLQMTWQSKKMKWKNKRERRIRGGWRTENRFKQGLNRRSELTIKSDELVPSNSDQLAPHVWQTGLTSEFKEISNSKRVLFFHAEVSLSADLSLHWGQAVCIKPDRQNTGQNKPTNPSRIKLNWSE